MFINNVLNNKVSLADEAIKKFNLEFNDFNIFNIKREMHMDEEYARNSENLFIYNIGNALEEMKVKIKDLSVPNHYDYVKLYEETNEHYYKGSTFVDEFMKIKQIKINLVFNDENSILKSIKQCINQLEDLWGIIAFMKSGDFVNITHPLTMLEFIYGKAKFNNIEKLMVFTIPPFIKENAEHKEENYNFYMDKLKDVYSLALCSIKDSYRNIKEEKKEDEEYIFGIGNFSIFYFVDREKENLKPDEKHFIIPCDKLATNLFIPYYGYLYLKYDNTTLNGKSLISWTNHSPNVGLAEKDSMALARVCTGLNKHYSYTGLNSMRIGNSLSPLTPYCINKKDCITWCKANLQTILYIIDEYQKRKEQNEQKDN